jgi:hypothetical protein
VSLRKLLGKLLIFTVLEIGVYSGMKVSQEEIEKVMNVMHRTKVVQIVKKEGE